MHEPDEPFLHDLVAKHIGARISDAAARPRDERSHVLLQAQRPQRAPDAAVRAQADPQALPRASAKASSREKQTIDAPIARIGAIKFGVRDGGKRADHARRSARSARGRLARSPIELETGRTHQIRVHLAAIGHPLAGDWLYGERNAARPMLHAAELEMTHPLTNQPLRVAAPVPDDFREEARRRGIRHLAEDRTDSLQSPAKLIESS